MQQRKRGNPYRQPRRRNRQRASNMKPLEPARLTLHRTDLITDDEDMLYSLFYEYYRGYTIYSTEQGRCCIHGKDGCLRIHGLYATFPDVEEARKLIKHFQADRRSTQESMNRFVPDDEYIFLNRRRSEPRRYLVGA